MEQLSSSVESIPESNQSATMSGDDLSWYDQLSTEQKDWILVDPRKVEVEIPQSYKDSM